MFSPAPNTQAKSRIKEAISQAFGVIFTIASWKNGRAAAKPNWEANETADARLRSGR